MSANRNNGLTLASILWRRALSGLSWTRVRRTIGRRGKVTYRCRPVLEELESRIALAPITSWADVGPQPQTKAVVDYPGLVGGMAAGESVPEAVTGRVTSLAQSGNSPLFLGSASGGVWMAANWDQPFPTWKLATDPKNLQNAMGQPLPPSEEPAGINNIGALAVDPQNPKIIYAGTGEANFQGEGPLGGNGYGAGILVSNNGGGTWRLIGPQFAGYAIEKIIVDPRKGKDNNLYAVVTPSNGPTNGAVAPGKTGVFWSNDFGATWTPLNVEGAGNAAPVTDLEYIQSDT
jgi:hypothetical protein